MSLAKNLRLTCSVIMGLGVLTIGSCAGLLYLGYRNIDKNISPKVDALFAAIEEDAFGDTYDEVASRELRSVVTKEQYLALGDLIQKRLGRLRSKSLSAFSMKQNNATSTTEVTYDATFQNGGGKIIVALVKEDGDWKFTTFRVESPLFEEDREPKVCPACGKEHPAAARFCPACGAELAPAEAEVPAGESLEDELNQV